MSAPHFLTVKRQSLQCRCFCCFVLCRLHLCVCVWYVYMLVCMCAYLAAAVVEQLPGLIII